MSTQNVHWFRRSMRILYRLIGFAIMAIEVGVLIWIVSLFYRLFTSTDPDAIFLKWIFLVLASPILLGGLIWFFISLPGMLIAGIVSGLTPERESEPPPQVTPMFTREELLDRIAHIRAQREQAALRDD